MISGQVHVFRTTPPQLIQSAFPETEACIRAFLGTAVFCCTRTDLEWSVIQLPFDLGGLELHPFEILAPCS